jgi:hypothetical protein
MPRIKISNTAVMVTMSNQSNFNSRLSRSLLSQKAVNYNSKFLYLT